jgi:signal transduction histidine kinase/ligand-binding sensor domain-containing protein
VTFGQRISRFVYARDEDFPSRTCPVLSASSRCLARTILFWVLLAVARPGAALPPNLSMSQIQHTAWTAEMGAPAEIWALAQSPDGFLLLGTGNGLYRFDGVTFERVVPSNHADLAFRDITALLSLPSGELWIGFYAGGVSELKDGVLTDYGPRDGMPSGWVTSFARESDGTLWVATRDGLGRFAGGRWETVSSDWNFPGHAAHWLLLDRHGTLWVTSGETVQFLRQGAHKFEDTGGIPAPYPSTLALDPDGNVWLAGQATSPRRLTEHEALLGRYEPPENLDPVKRMLIDREGSLWATDSLRGGVYRLTRRDHGSDAATTHPFIEMFNEADGLTSQVAVPILEDREGNIWVGTNLGLNRFRATPFVREWRVPASPMGYALAAEPDGAMWIASQKQLFEVRGSRCDLIVSVTSAIRSAYREPNGTLWLGTHEGVVELIDRKPNLLSLPTPAQPVQYQFVRAIMPDSSNELWASVVNRGLLRLVNRRWELPGSVEPMSEPTPTALWTDPQHRQWFGYSDGTATMREGGSTREFGPQQGLQVGPVTVIRGSSTEVFVAGEWGLARFDGRQFQSLSATRSEAFSGVTGIIVRANGDVWLNGNRGAVHMTPDAVTDAYDHPLAKLRYDLFDVHDGLPGYAYQGQDGTAVAAADGRLWFATNHGIAWIDPDHLSKNVVPPHVVIRAVLADERAYRAPGPIELPDGIRSVRIDYTALSLAAPERVRFRYKLDGADDSWREAGSERSVRYAGLRPGRYTFRVIASNNDGVWNNDGAAVTFALRPAFYQTSWFFVSALAACLAMLWLLAVARLRQIAHRERKRLEQRMEDRLGERTRIARELHDSLLQGFQGVMFRLQAVRELLPERPRAAAQSLDATLELGDEAIGESRDAVQNLRSSIFEDGDLPTVLGALGAELAAEMEPDAASEYRVVVEGKPRELNPNVRDDIYSIAREAVRNAYQHAQAKLIETEVTFGEAEFSVRVRDDGIGVDPAILARGHRVDHWGFPGMRERSDTVGGRLYAWSERNIGTEIEFRIPAKIAYALPPILPYQPMLRFFKRMRMRATQPEVL